MDTATKDVGHKVSQNLQLKAEACVDDLTSDINVDGSKDSSTSSNFWGPSPDSEDAPNFGQDDASTLNTSSSSRPEDVELTKAGWDDHVAELPPDPPPDRPLPPPAPLEPVENFETACFKTRHYFLKWLQTTLEAACFDFGMQYLKCHLEKRDTYSLRWTEPGRIALDTWTGFYDDYKIPGPFSEYQQRLIRNGAAQLRHKTVHREDLDIEYLKAAMLLPEMLMNPELGDKVKWVYDAVRDYENLDEKVRREVDEILYPEEKPPIHPYQLVQRIQDILESVFFTHVRRTTPEFLAQRGLFEAEQVELQAYQDHGYREVDYSALWVARRIRNDATHRNMIPCIEDRVRQGKDLAIMFGNPAQADKIQRLADEFLVSWDPESSDGSGWTFVGERVSLDPESSDGSGLTFVEERVSFRTRISKWFALARRDASRTLKRKAVGLKRFQRLRC